MRQNLTPSEILLEGIEKHYAQIHRLVKYLCITFVILISGTMIWLSTEYVKSGSQGGTGYIIFLVVFISLILLGFRLAFVSLKRRRIRSKSDIQYFIDTPNSVVSYQIVAGGYTNLILVGEYKTAGFSVQLDTLQIEEAILKMFPHLQNNKTQVASEKAVVAERPHIDKSKLMDATPKALRVYFAEKFKQKLGCLPYIVGILLALIILSIIGHFGWYSFWVFEPGNSYWLYFLIPFILFSVGIFFSKSEDKKIRELIRNPDNIIWIYLSKTKKTTMGVTTTGTINLVIANVKTRHYVTLYEKEDETLLWLSLYCPKAAVGFYYEWEEIYDKNPKEFLNLINRQSDSEV